MGAGINLAESIGLFPYKTSACCAAIRENWDNIFPGGYSSFFRAEHYVGYQTSNKKRQAMYLLAYDDQITGFTASVLKEVQMLEHLVGEASGPRPAVTMNLTNYMFALIASFMEHLMDTGHE